jgi:hypothetical protein
MQPARKIAPDLQRWLQGMACQNEKSPLFFLD